MGKPRNLRLFLPKMHEFLGILGLSLISSLIVQIHACPGQNHTETTSGSNNSSGNGTTVHPVVVDSSTNSNPLNGQGKRFICTCMESAAGNGEYPGSGGNSGQNNPGSGNNYPGAGNNNPGSDNNNPGSGSSNPGSSGNNPGSGNTTPGSENGNPGSGNDNSGPGDNNTGSENTTPGSENSNPGSGNNNSGPDGNNTGSENTTPGSGNNNPGTGNNNSGPGSTNPEPGNNNPGSGSTTTGSGNSNPGTGNNNSGPGNTNPEPGSTNPGSENGNPGSGSTNPGSENGNPGSGSNNSGSGDNTPGSGSNNPGSGGSNPGPSGGGNQPGSNGNTPSSGNDSGSGGLSPGIGGGGIIGELEEDSASEIEIVLTEAELEMQIVEMFKFLTVQMEAPGGWNNTDQSTKTNTSSLGIPDLGVFRQIFTGFGENIKRDSVCAGCQVYTGVLMHQINRRNESRENLETFAIFTCRFFRLAHPDVCQGIVNRLGPTFYWIVKQRRNELSPQEFCGVTLQSLGCRISKKKQNSSEFNWEVDPQQYIPAVGGSGGGISGGGIIGGGIVGGGGIGGSGSSPSSTTTMSPDDYDQPDPTDNVENFTPLTTRRQDNQPVKILHLADIHVDLDYKTGTDADCENEVLCCQERFGWPNSTEVGAGYYGDNRRCDAPMKMVHLALRQIQRQHPDIDLIYMTGDLVPHNIWYTTQEENEEIIRVISKTLLDYFPNTRIIPVLGNHESHPVNLYSPTSREFDPPESNPIPEELRQDWVYEVAYESWKQWIPSGERENFLRSGNYVVELNHKMRAIVVNTNVCYGFNMWQTYKPRDPGDMLQWLQNELYITKKMGKTAHILGHVPPGHEDCTKTWSREFYKIIARYKNTVKGQFYGHTHYDEFRILHDPQNKSMAINMMWIGPSLTPYRIYNPGYRIYHMDVNETTYGDIIDHETWIYDIEKSNELYRQMYGENGTQEASPEEDDRFVEWFQLYQATKAYNVPNVLPETMRGFVSRMAKNEETFGLFYRHYFKAIDDEVYEKEPCDTVCKKRILCGIVRPYYDDDEGHVECNDVQKEVDGIALPLRTLDLKRRFIWL